MPKSQRRRSGGSARPAKSASSARPGPPSPTTPPPAAPSIEAASPADAPLSESGLPGLVLRAARDIGRVETAFDAELLLSTLLGSVYAAVLPDREQAHESFVAALRAHLTEATQPAASLVTHVLAALAGGESPINLPAVDPAPAWLGELGQVHVTGGYAYGDRYGDQTTYLTTYAYRDPTLGGPEHAVVILVDHNLGLAKDLLIASPASTVVDQLRSSAGVAGDEMTWFIEVDPSTVRTATGAYMRATDNAAELPDEDSLPANRALALARLASLPSSSPAADSTSPDEGGTGRTLPLIDEFLQSPEAQLAGFADAADAQRESVLYCVGLVADFALRRGGDALRWSPRAVELFLLDWVHQRAVLDADDERLMPDVLGAWVSWAGRRVDLPVSAITETVATVRASREEFARLRETGERQSPAARAMAQMVADGVDLADTAAVDKWLSSYVPGPGSTP